MNTQNTNERDQALNKMLIDLDVHLSKLTALHSATLGSPQFYVVIVNDAYTVGVDGDGKTKLSSHTEPYYFSKKDADRVISETSYKDRDGNSFKAREVVRATVHFDRMIKSTRETIDNIKGLVNN